MQMLLRRVEEAADFPGPLERASQSSGSQCVSGRKSRNLPGGSGKALPGLCVVDASGQPTVCHGWRLRCVPRSRSEMVRDPSRVPWATAGFTLYPKGTLWRRPLNLHYVCCMLATLDSHLPEVLMSYFLCPSEHLITSVFIDCMSALVQ